MSVAKELIDSLKEDVGEVMPKVGPTYMKLIEVYPLQPISSRAQHKVALKIVEKLMTHLSEVEPRDKGIEIYLRTLSELVSDYETEQFRTSDVSGREMLEYLMDLQQLDQGDLAKDLGGQSVVSKILSGQRELNIRQITALAKRFDVSPMVFIS